MALTYDQIVEKAASNELMIMGALSDPDDLSFPEGTKSAVLLGPTGAGFWKNFQQQPEFLDNDPDPVDRWSTRVITSLSQDFGGTALFPFGDPARPFISWALASGRAWLSPAHMLVHDTTGLWVSYRGCIALPYPLSLPDPGHMPCENCADKPCLSACPPRALTADTYDLAACHTFLDTTPGQNCMSQGCAVRRACPVGHNYGRQHGQSALHMRSFHK